MQSSVALPSLSVLNIELRYVRYVFFALVKFVIFYMDSDNVPVNMNTFGSWNCDLLSVFLIKLAVIARWSY